MKKGTYTILAGIILSVMMLSFASAYYFPDLRYVSQGVINKYVDVFEPILNALFGGYGGWSGLYLFERLLLFILLVSVVYVSLTKATILGENKAVRWVISIIVPLIAIRFINYEWLSALFTQYAILGIIVTAVLPFVLFFYFIYGVAGDHGAIRKCGWLMFLGIYAGLWSTGTTETNSAVYFWTTIAALGCLMLDGFIYRRYRALAMLRQDPAFKAREIANVNTEIHQIQNQIGTGAMDRKTGEKIIKDLTAHKIWLAKQS